MRAICFNVHMEPRRPHLFQRTDIWREGEYLDLWSVPHFLSGLVLGLVLHLTAMPLRDSLIVAFLILVMYEMWEDIAQIEETRWNKALDIVVGMVSCTGALLYAPAFTPQAVIAILVVVGVLDAVLSFFGWQASQKAAAFEAKMRLEFKERRRKFTERIREERARWRKSRER